MTFVQNTTPTIIKQPQNGKAQIVNSTGTGNVTVYTAGANGSKVVCLIAQSNDTAAHDLHVGIANGGTTYWLGTVTVPIGAGNSGTVPSVDLLNAIQLPGIPFDSDGNHFINLISGDTLVVAALVAVTSGDTINLTAAAIGDF